MAHLAKKIIKMTMNRELSKEEEQGWDDFEHEVLVPTLKWSVTGIVLIWCLTRFAIDLIGVTIILLSLYLIYGLFKFNGEFNDKLRALREQISRKRVFFTTDMGGRVRNQFMVGAFVFILCIIYTMVGIHTYAGFAGALLRIEKIWVSLAPTTQIDVVALIFSFTISAVVVLTMIFKISRISNLVITEEGLFIGDSHLTWGEIQHCEVEYFFKRPVDLVIASRGGSIIRIQLSRFRIDRDKAEEIAALINQNVH